MPCVQLIRRLLCLVVSGGPSPDQPASRPDRAVLDTSRLERRAVEIVGQLAATEWEAASADWDDNLRAKLPLRQLAEVWAAVVAGAGPLIGVGAPTLTRRGPYRICDVPLEFEGGPMKARVTFNYDARVGGLLILLPDVP